VDFPLYPLKPERMIVAIPGIIESDQLNNGEEESC
jgi:hypothetical protein